MDQSGGGSRIQEFKEFIQEEGGEMTPNTTFQRSQGLRRKIPGFVNSEAREFLATTCSARLAWFRLKHASE